MKNKVQLITYADRLGGGGFKQLHDLLKGPLGGLFGGVHLLPFFHPIDGADAGFDPIDHTQVDSRLGSWADIKRLADDIDVMGDVIVNHISSQSPQFVDFVANGASSRHAELFLTFDRVFPNGASEQDLTAIYRPRPGLPFTVVTLANGARRVMWTTFAPEQIDIDVRHPVGRAYLETVLTALAAGNIRSVRLDAVGYAIKKPGANCFMIPETFEFIDEFAKTAHALGIEVLVEIHGYYRKQLEIAAHVDWVYDFALAPLVLHAFAFRTAEPLKEWIRIRPRNTLTVLDTHDGIGIVDIGADSADPAGRPGLVPDAELDRVVEVIHERSGGTSRRATGAAASNLDLYQANCTFYDALGRDDAQYLLARALQFFLPGIPQVYYVGLLAGMNDMELLEASGVGRNINRHYYSRAEIDQALARPVVQDLFDLIRLRNSHPAFDGTFSFSGENAHSLQLRWASGPHLTQLTASFRTGQFELLATGDGELRGFAPRGPRGA